MTGIASPFLGGSTLATPFLREEEAPATALRDEVDDFLVSRRALYKVVLVGTQVQVTLSREHEWARRYTSRALTEGALGAALNQMFMGGVNAAQARKAYAAVVGHGVKFTPADAAAERTPLHTTVVDERALRQFAAPLNLHVPRDMATAWRLRYQEARLLAYAVLKLRDTYDSVVPQMAAKDLAAAHLTVPLIRDLLNRRTQSLVQEARHHDSTAWWRAAFERNLALQSGEREPALADFPVVPVAQWAKTLVRLAAATRDTLRRQLAQELAARRRDARNQHLSPHEIQVTDAARFILETYEPTHTERLHTTQWEVHGGQQLTNIHNQPLLLLRVESARVVFQNLADKKFYQQSLEGLGEEQLYSIYADAGRKALGAIALSQWVLGLAGAVFPVVRYGLMATDVLNAAGKLHAHRAELERHYASLRLAYANIDALLPGVLPKVWDAVLDKRNLVLFNPLKNPDAGAWLKAVIRLVMLRQARVVNASYVADAVNGFLNKAWDGIKKGLGLLLEVVIHAVVLTPPIAGSTGVSGERALDLAVQRLQSLGVADALLVGQQVRRLTRGDQDRLSREIRDLSASGVKLLDIVKQSLAW